MKRARAQKGVIDWLIEDVAQMTGIVRWPVPSGVKGGYVGVIYNTPQGPYFIPAHLPRVALERKVAQLEQLLAATSPIRRYHLYTDISYRDMARMTGIGLNAILAYAASVQSPRWERIDHLNATLGIDLGQWEGFRVKGRKGGE